MTRTFRVPPPLPVDEFRALWDAGVTTLKIAAKAGRPPQTISKWAKTLGFPPRPAGSTDERRQTPSISNEQFAEWWHAGMTIDCISRKAGVTPHVVGRIARELGLPLRNQTHAQRLPAIKDEFTRLWLDASVSRRDIGRRFGVHEETTSKWAKVFGLGDKVHDEPDWSEPQPGDPTEEEILELAAYLRARRTMMKAFNFEDGEIVDPLEPVVSYHASHGGSRARS